MNKKLKQKAIHIGEQALPVLFLTLVFVCGVAAGTYLGIITFDQVGNQSINQTLQNKTDVNITKYYDNKTGVCQTPDINQTNVSQLKACVNNQTSVS